MSRPHEGHPYEERMVALCQSIPALAGMPECATWDSLRLARRWGTASSGERACIQFVLNVWDRHWKDWHEAHGIPPFTIQDFAALDDDNCAAIAKWFAKPFWP
jgi:hypothetical protein